MAGACTDQGAGSRSAAVAHHRKSTTTIWAEATVSCAAGSEATEVAAAQEPLVVGPAQAVGGPGDQRHAEADEVGPSGGLPRLHDHEDPEEPHEHADDLAPADDVTAQEQQAEDHRGDGVVALPMPARAG